MAYLKNVSNSVGYMIADISKELFPNIYDSREQIKATTDAVKNINVASIAKKTEKAIKNSDFVKGVKQFNKNAIAGLKSGKLYMQESDIDFGFGDFDDEFDSLFEDMDDDDDSQESAAKIVAKSSKTSSQAIVTATVNSSSAMIRSMESIVTASIGKIESGNVARHAETIGLLKAQNDNLAQLVRFNNESFRKFIEKSTAYYTKQDEMSEALVAKMEDQTVTLGEMYNKDGIKGFAKGAKEKLKNNSMLGGMAEMLGPMLQSYISNPGALLKDGVTGLLKGKLGLGRKAGAIDKLFGSFNDMSQGIFRNLAGSKNPLLSYLGGSLRDKTGGTIRAKTTTEEKEAHFTNVTKIAIEKVMPTYLRKILAAVSGQKEMFYDATTGKFASAKEIHAKIQKQITSTDYVVQDDFTNKLHSSMKDNMQGQVSQSDFNKLFKIIVKSMISANMDLNSFIAGSWEGISNILTGFKEDEFYLIRDALVQMKHGSSDQRKEFERINSEILASSREKLEKMRDIKKAMDLSGLSSLMDGSTDEKRYHMDKVSNETYDGTTARQKAGVGTMRSKKGFNDDQARYGIGDYYKGASINFMKEMEAGHMVKGADGELHQFTGISDKMGQAFKGQSVSEAIKGKFGRGIDGAKANIGKVLANLKFNDGKKVQDSGCGLISAVMAYNYINKSDVNPAFFFDLASKYHVPNDGIKLNFFTEFASRVGLKIEILSKATSIDKIKKYVSDGNGVVVLRNTVSSGSKHYVAITGVSGDNFSIHDPWEKNLSSINMDTMASLADNYIVLFKSNDKAYTVYENDNEDMEDSVVGKNMKVSQYGEGEGSANTSSSTNTYSSAKGGGISLPSFGSKHKNKNLQLLGMIAASNMKVERILANEYGELSSSISSKIESTVAKVVGMKTKGGKGIKGHLKSIKGKITGINNKVFGKGKAAVSKALSFINPSGILGNITKGVKGAGALAVKGGKKAYELGSAALPGMWNMTKKGAGALKSGAGLLKTGALAAGTGLLAASKTGAQGLVKGVKGAGSLIGQAGKGLGSGVKMLGTGLSQVGTVAKKITGKLGTGISKVGGVLGKATGKVGAMFSKAFGTVKGTAKSVAGKLKRKLKGKVQYVQIVGGYIDSVGSMGTLGVLGTLGKKLWKKNKDKDPDKITMATGPSNAGDLIKSAVPKSAVASIGATQGDGKEDDKKGGLLSKILGFGGIGAAMASKLKSKAFGVLNSAKDMGKSAIVKVKGAVSKAATGMIKAIKKGLVALGEHLTNIFKNGVVKFAVGGEKMASKVRGIIPKIMKFLSSKAEKLGMKALLKGGAKTALSTVGIGAVLGVGTAIWQAVKGYHDAGKIFGEKDLTKSKKITSALIGGLKGLMEWIPFVGIVFAFIPNDTFIKFVYNLIAGKPEETAKKDEKKEEEKTSKKQTATKEKQKKEVKKATTEKKKTSAPKKKDPIKVTHKKTTSKKKKSKHMSTKSKAALSAIVGYHHSTKANGVGMSASKTKVNPYRLSGDDKHGMKAMDNDMNYIDSHKGMSNNLSFNADDAKVDFTNMVPAAVQMIAKHEGFRPKVYKDSVGLDTIGYGFNIDGPAQVKRYGAKNVARWKKDGITKEESQGILYNYVVELARKVVNPKNAKRYNNFFTAFEGEYGGGKAAMLDFAYNIGLPGANKWVNTMQDIKDKQMSATEYDFLKSKYAKQVGHRANDVASGVIKGMYADGSVAGKSFPKINRFHPKTNRPADHNDIHHKQQKAIHDTAKEHLNETKKMNSKLDSHLNTLNNAMASQPAATSVQSKLGKSLGSVM